MAAFSFFKDKSFTNQKELRIGKFDNTHNAFPLYFNDPETDSLNQTWMCPRAFLETYLMDFFHFIYEDSKKPDGFQLDCVMMPSIYMMLKNNDVKVHQVLKSLLRMLEMYATHGNPDYRTV